MTKKAKTPKKEAAPVEVAAAVSETTAAAVAQNFSPEHEFISPGAKPAPPPSEFNLAGSTTKGQERVSALADKLGRTWGRSSALPLSSAPVAHVMRLPFGILMLDWRTGGLGIGRVNRVWGAKSTLKSTLCLRALRSAQRHCRHCKFPIVTDPASGAKNCRCPSPRWWLKDPEDYAWLPATAAIKVSHGELPEGCEVRKIKGAGVAPVLKCEPPVHLAGTKAGGKAREIVFTEAFRCEPMRCLYLDSEGTIDEAWAKANGVDTALVLLVGGKWAEQSLASLEEAILEKEFDFIVIDSTSMLESQANLNKAITESPVVASKANLMGRFMRRFISASFEDGLTARYRPTILATSQVTTKGIGYGQHAYLGPTDGNVFEHGLSLDIRMTEAGYTFDSSGQRALHGDFNFEVKKNKLGGSPRAQGQIRFWLVADEDHPVGDSDDLTTVMDYARKLGEGYMTDGTGKSTITLHTPFTARGRVMFSRVGDAERFLRTHTTIYDDLRERVLAKLNDTGASLEVAGTSKPAVAAEGEKG